MPAIRSYFIEPIFEQFRALLPEREVNHPLGCHRSHTPDRVVFDKLTINSSIRGYYEGMHSWSEPEPRLGVPAGLALFSREFPPPREMAERFFNVRRWTEMPRGGHFAAMEEPELLVEDIRAYFRELR